MSHKKYIRKLSLYEKMTSFITAIIGLVRGNSDTGSTIKDSVGETLDCLEKGKGTSELDELVNDNSNDKNRLNSPRYFPNFRFALYNSRYLNNNNSIAATVNIDDDEYRVMEEIKYHKQLIIMDQYH